MISIYIVCVGNLKEEYLRNAAKEYIKRLTRFCKPIIIELPESIPSKEKISILRSCHGIKIALCVEGDQLTSEQLACTINKYSMQSSAITFIIGSSTGLDEEVKKSADLKLSFSKMTFPHQLMRIILLEQVYRAFTINNNIKYHK